MLINTWIRTSVGADLSASVTYTVSHDFVNPHYLPLINLKFQLIGNVVDMHQASTRALNVAVVTAARPLA